MARVISSSTVAPGAGNSATIDRKWLPWVRAGWLLVVLNAVIIFAFLVYQTWAFANNLPPRIATGLNELGWSPDVFFAYHSVFMTLGFVCFLATGCFIFFVRPTERMALFASIFLIALGAENVYPLAAEFAATWQNAPILFRTLYFINNFFAWSFLVAFFALFPDGRFVPSWSRYVALYGCIYSIFFGLFPSTFGAPEGWIAVWATVSLAVVFGGSLFAQIWRYRNYATTVQKQQTKWMIFALAVLLLGYVSFGVIVYIVFPNTQVAIGTGVAIDLAYFGANMVLLLVPFAVAIAVVRYRLWDIDIIIRKTLTYALLAALLSVIYFASIIILGTLFASLIGKSSDVITVVSTLAIAALFVPLRNRIQEAIDRRFYRKKYDAQQVLTAFAATVRDETDLEKLAARLMQVVDETMQPESVSMWLKQDRRR